MFAKKIWIILAVALLPRRLGLSQLKLLIPVCLHQELLSGLPKRKESLPSMD